MVDANRCCSRFSDAWTPLSEAAASIRNTVLVRASNRQQTMGIILPRPALRENERRKIEARLKLFDQLRKQYIADGIPANEATARAMAKVRATKFE